MTKEDYNLEVSKLAKDIFIASLHPNGDYTETENRKMGYAITKAKELLRLSGIQESKEETDTL